MEPWYRVVTARKEVREGRSFNPDEFAIALEQVVTGKAPADYSKPAEFFKRTCFTRALRDHAGMVLRRLSGETTNTAPVLTLITQFGGGKTHTLTTLLHLARSGSKANNYEGIPALLRAADLKAVPEAKVAVFVGNAWDPGEGSETPWIDIARQLAGEKGVKALGPDAKTSPPGTETIRKVFDAAGEPVLILFDEVLNLVNRKKGLADHFLAFIHNLTVAMTGTPQGAAVISLPRSQVEMTDFDAAWQEKITKVVKRVAKDLIANDEAEIAEVVRRRLFENLGDEKLRRKTSKEFADWCFVRRAELPSEWTAVDTAATDAKAREYLQGRFESCYPFHPATLSVFQRKWQTLPQYQQTRGTLAMLAQWISHAQRDGYREARREPLITLGSAPLHVPEFCSVVLGQLGEMRLGPSIEADIAGAHSHARALDADTKEGPLRDIHRRVATAILFESSGGQSDKSAHLPELRFALGEPGSDTTSVDTAAHALETRAYYIRKVGSDGFQIRHQANLKKVVNDRRASLDAEEIRSVMETLTRIEFDQRRVLPVVPFPADGAAIADTPKLSVVLMPPDADWADRSADTARVLEWTRARGSSPRLFPAALAWCFKKSGRELRDRVEDWLAWKRIKRELEDGTLGGDYGRADKAEIQTKVTDSEQRAKDEVWASYRYLVLVDARDPSGLKVIDIGAGHASAGESLTGRILSTLKSQGLLNESVGSGYLDRNWPPALKESGAWPLSSLRQSFLDGTFTRLADPDAVLRLRVAEFVAKGDFGLGSGQRPDGSFERLWLGEEVPVDEVSFESGVFLLRKQRAQALRAAPTEPAPPTVEPAAKAGLTPEFGGGTQPGTGITAPGRKTCVLTLSGDIPSELWNRFGTKVIPKLKGHGDLSSRVELRITMERGEAATLAADLKQALADLGVATALKLSVE